MNIDGKFNINAEALVNRIFSHDKYGRNDLNKWIFNNLSLDKGMSVIDIGCGTGKQTIPIAKIIGKFGKILSVDISSEALNILNKESLRLGLNDRITTLCSKIDDLDNHIEENTFDRIISSYSLYYSNNCEKIIETLWSALKPGGVLFFCGPSHKNNSELKKFHYKLKGISVPLETEASHFMENTSHKFVKKFFNKFDILYFINPLQYVSVDSLHAYWSSYNLYDEKLNKNFIKRLSQNLYEWTGKRWIISLSKEENSKTFH